MRPWVVASCVWISTGIGVAPVTTGSTESRWLEPLAEPAAVAVDHEGAIYVCERLGHRVSVFGPDGRPRRRIGSFGRGDGELDGPQGIALGDDGRIFVADTGNDRIEVFGRDGRFERAWGRQGSAPGEFDEPLGLAIAGGRLFVADALNNRVQVFRLDGTLLFYLWSYGSIEGAFDRPVAVAAHAEDALFVSDQGNNRVQKFRWDGRFERAFGGRGSRGALLAEPGGLDLRDGVLTVADSASGRLVTYDESGSLVVERRMEDMLDEPDAVASLTSGESLVACSTTEDRCRVVDLSPDTSEPAGLAPRGVPASGYVLGGSGDTLIVAPRPTGRPFLLDTSRAAPAFLGFLGAPGREPLEFSRPEGFILDASQETLLIADTGSARIQRLGLPRDDAGRLSPSRARYINGIGLDDQERLEIEPAGWHLSPADVVPGALVRDRRERILVADVKSRRIVVLDDTFRLRASWGGPGDEDGRFRSLDGLASAPGEAIVYALDARRGRIQAFDLDGRFLRAWGRRGTAPGDWSEPSGIAASRDGSVYLVDRAAACVTRFDASGRVLAKWGTPGRQAGQFRKPESVHVDGEGRVLVSDSGNRRLQAFTSRGIPLWETPLDPAKIERPGPGQR